MLPRHLLCFLLAFTSTLLPCAHAHDFIYTDELYDTAWESEDCSYIADGATSERQAYYLEIYQAYDNGTELTPPTQIESRSYFFSQRAEAIMTIETRAYYDIGYLINATSSETQFQFTREFFSKILTVATPSGVNLLDSVCPEAAAWDVGSYDIIDTDCGDLFWSCSPTHEEYTAISNEYFPSKLAFSVLPMSGGACSELDRSDYFDGCELKNINPANTLRISLCVTIFSFIALFI